MCVFQSGGEDPVIQNFIRAIYEMDCERDAVEKRYNEHFRIFVKLWKGILSEKKELNSKFKEFQSARASLKQKNKKMVKAESKVRRARRLPARPLVLCVYGHAAQGGSVPMRVPTAQIAARLLDCMACASNLCTLHVPCGE